jgi:hypothetical protein
MYATLERRLVNECGSDDGTLMWFAGPACLRQTETLTFMRAQSTMANDLTRHQPELRTHWITAGATK